MLVLKRIIPAMPDASPYPGIAGTATLAGTAQAVAYTNESCIPLNKCMKYVDTLVTCSE